MQDATRASTHLYVSCYNSGNPDFDGPKAVVTDNVLMFARDIPHSTLRLGDTFGKTTATDQRESLASLKAEGINPDTVACHFHYDEAETVKDNLVRVSSLMTVSAISGISDFDGNSLAGGSKNPLTKSGASTNPSGNLQYLHFLGTMAALKVPVPGLSTTEEMTSSAARCMSAQTALFPTVKDFSSALSPFDMQQACETVLKSGV